MASNTKVSPADQPSFKVESTLVSGSLEQALLKSTLYDKCQALTAALKNISTRELQQQFPIVVQKIFGFGLYPPGWQLELMHKHKCRRDADAVIAFLHPNGAMFTDLIYKLMCEDVVFEFPYQFIPEATKRKIEEGLPISELYNNKFTTSAGAQVNPVLVLDAFEYYFFIFTHKMVSSTTKGMELYLEPADWLYPTLLNDYLQHFLPMRGLPSAPPYTISSKTSVLQLLSPSLRSSTFSPHLPPTQRRHGLGLLKQTPSYFSRSLSIQQSVNSESSIDSDIMWRSERIVQILSEFWMGQTAVDTPHPSMNFSDCAGTRFHTWDRSHDQACSLVDLLCTREPLPSHDLIMLVRMLIKHIHAFIHTSDGDVLPSYHQNPSTVLGALKRSMLARFIQKPFYGFVKHAVENWPLDTSFRPILETWLTFVRPWRYACNSASEGLQSGSPTPTAADSKADADTADFSRLWDGFVREHSLFYSVILQEVLNRFLRIDLASSKMSYQLSRVCHVFSLSKLIDILREVDMSARARSYALPDYQDDEYTDVTSGGSVQILEAQINAVEAPNFIYRPLFSEEMLQQVYALLREMVNAQQRIATQIKKLEERQASAEGHSLLSFLGLGKMVEFNDAQVSTQDRDYSLTAKWLEQSTAELSTIFKIQVPDYDYDVSLNTMADGTSENQPDHIVRSDGSVELTALGRYQVLNGLRRFAVIEGRCDPDLQPVRSFESDIGVVQLYKLSCFANNKYGEWFARQYNKDGIIGAVARQILTLPKRGTERNAYSNTSQPRISLRVFANYYFLGYSVVGYLVMSGLVGCIPAFLLVCLLFVLYIGIMALLDSFKRKV